MKLVALLVIGIILHLHGEQNVNAKNILALMAITSPSHHIWNSVLLMELANRGHNMTILSVDLPKNLDKLPPNVHYIHLEEAYNSFDSNEQVDVKDLIGLSALAWIPLFYDCSIKKCIGIFKSKGLTTLMNYNDDFKFDLIIDDYTTGPCLLGFVHKFNYPPLIGISAFLNPPITTDLIGHHYFPAYIPYYSTSYDVYMNFFQRAYNTIIYILDTMYRRSKYLPELNEFVRSRYAENMPPLRELEQRTVLALVNSHPAINYPESLPPNVIEVGGLQIKDPKPLPKDIEDWIEAGKMGAIFFSMGTNVRGDDLGPQKVQIIIDAMAQIKNYNFLWKLDWDLDAKGFDLPKNVLVKSFFPQSDILGHPKIMAFVTHAGGLSTQESIWRGVPMVGIPLFMDQIRNLENSIAKGVATKVDFMTLTVESLRDNILKVLNEPSYRQDMKILSSRFRDRPMKPLDLAVWWIEYVLRDPQSNHLKSPALKIGFMRAHSIDMLAVTLVLTVLICGLLTILVRKLLSYIKKPQAKNRQNKNRQNRKSKND